MVKDYTKHILHGYQKCCNCNIHTMCFVQLIAVAPHSKDFVEKFHAGVWSSRK